MRRPALTPAVVVEAAASVADELGFDAVTLSAVARRLGVKAPSLYSHVRNLTALRDGITELALRELNARMARAVAGRSGRDALRGLAGAHRAFAHEMPGRWQSLQRPTSEAVASSDAARDTVALTSSVLLGYDLPQAEQVHAIRLLGAAISGFLALERFGSFAHSTPSAEASWDRALDALDASLRNWPVAANDKEFS